MTRFLCTVLAVTLLLILSGCDCNDETTPPSDGDFGDMGPNDAQIDYGKPPVQHGTIGRFSALAASKDALYISAYENNYGDLVLISVPTTDLTKLSKKVLDGVPSVTPPQPGTYRGGITAAGDDVGQDTDIHASPTGEILISYRDVTNRSLKVATRVGDAWATHTVQQPSDAKEVVGRYTSLLFVGGKPTITYLVLNISAGSGTFKSELRHAAATKQVPAAAADWTITTIDSGAMSCENLCDAPDVCALDTNGDSACAAAGSGCSPACATGEECVGGNCTPVLPDVKYLDVPRAVGMWPCTAGVGGKAVVLYYDRIAGNLKGAVSSGTAWSPVIVKGTTTDDVGAYCSMVAGGAGDIHVAYQDAAKLSLNYLHLDPTTLKAKLTEVIDDGVRADGPHPVGADSAIIVDPTGKVRVVYQDSQNTDLLTATRAGPNSWTPNDSKDGNLGRMVRGGARGYGFYTDLVTADGEVYGSTFYFDQDGKPKGNLELFRLQ